MVEHNEKNVISFYKELCLQRKRYEEIIKKAKKIIRNYTGMSVELVGSYAMGIEILGSDIDFALGCPSHEKKREIKGILSNKMEYRGERPATIDTTRFLFCMKIDGVHIDLNIMDQEDYFHLVKGLKIANNSLTMEEKQRCVFKKSKLKHSNKKEFEKYKLDIYQKFCPQLLWLPDYEIRAIIEHRCIGLKKELPQWLIEKKQNEKS